MGLHHRVQVDDMAPLHDWRDSLQVPYEALARAEELVALQERIAEAHEKSLALILHARSSRLRSCSNVTAIGLKDLIDLHAEIATIKTLADAFGRHF